MASHLARAATHAAASCPRPSPARPGTAPIPELGWRRRGRSVVRGARSAHAPRAAAATSTDVTTPAVAWWGDPAAAAAAATPAAKATIPPWRLAPPDYDPGLASLLARVEAAWVGAGAVRVDLDEGVAYKDSGQEGAAASPHARFRLENRVYSHPAFRKLHLEAAVKGGGEDGTPADLAVLHGVAFPWVDYAIPILAFDLVATTTPGGGGGGGPATAAPRPLAPLSLAIIDPSPVTPDGSLPPDYAAGVAAIQAAHPGAASNRAAPEWGAAIFSTACVLARPGRDASAAAAFAAYAADLVAFHLEYAARYVREAGGRGGPLRPRSPAAPAVAAAHARWAEHQLRNDRTRRVLAASFGAEWADRYMTGVMFDVEEGV